MATNNTLHPASPLEVYRRAAGFSREQLAEAVGVHRETVARIERAEARPLGVTAAAIARTLRVPVSELFPEVARRP